MQYIGFDIHKRYTFYTQMSETGAIQRQGKLTNTREALGEFFANVAEPARVAMEATMNWYHLFDLLEVLEIPVTLAPRVVSALRGREVAKVVVVPGRLVNVVTK